MKKTLMLFRESSIALQIIIETRMNSIWTMVLTRGGVQSSFAIGHPYHYAGLIFTDAYDDVAYYACMHNHAYIYISWANFHG